MGMTASFVHEGAINGEIFQAYVERVLMPTLSPGDIVVLDNLSAHKIPSARKAIELAGAQIWIGKYFINRFCKNTTKIC
ncbi:hypothetical protein GCM10023158_14050 [Gluconacetobacter tumulicola]